MAEARFPHHDWADADGLQLPDPEFAVLGYYRHDPDSRSERLRHWHAVLWSKDLPRSGRLNLQADRTGLRDTDTGQYLKSDAAVPVWERWREVRPFLAQTQEHLHAHGRGSIHDLGWRLYDMGGMMLFPGLPVNRAWTINQAKGCTRTRIADRLDLTLECIRLYYLLLPELTDPLAALPEGYGRTNPLAAVLHRYRAFFELFQSFDEYVAFWLLDDLVTHHAAGPKVNFLLPRAETGPYDFTREAALPKDPMQYFEYLVAADDFVVKRNIAMAQAAHQQGHDVCQHCLAGSGRRHEPPGPQPD